MQTFLVLSDDATMSAQVSAALSKFKILTHANFSIARETCPPLIVFTAKYIGHSQRRVHDAVLVLEEVSLGLKYRLTKV